MLEKVITKQRQSREATNLFSPTREEHSVLYMYPELYSES